MSVWKDGRDAFGSVDVIIFLKTLQRGLPMPPFSWRPGPPAAAWRPRCPGVFKGR